MKQFRRITAVVVAGALACLVIAPLASATTLEVKGIKKNEAVALRFTLAVSTSMLLTDTFGFFANTCTSSTKEGKTESPFTGTRVGGKLSTLSFSNCVEEPIVVDTPGSLFVDNIAGTTNGTVRSFGAKVTVPSPFGLLTCTTATGEGTDIGRLTGVASGFATVDMNAVLPCGSLTAKWVATYTVTSP